MKQWWFWVAIVAGWLPFAKRFVSLWWRSRQIARQVRILDHGTSSLRQILTRFPSGEIDDQPMPSHNRSDDRYELKAAANSEAAGI